MLHKSGKLMGVNSKMKVTNTLHTQQESDILLNSPVPMFVLNSALEFVASSDSFKDIFVSSPENISQVLQASEYNLLLTFLESRRTGTISLSFKASSGTESFLVQIQENDLLLYFYLFPQKNTDDKNLLIVGAEQAPLPLHEALISLEELQERTDSLRKEADYRRTYLRKVIDTIPSYIDIRDENGVIMLANKPLANYFGLDIKQLVGKTMCSFFSTHNMADKIGTEHKRVFRSWTPTYKPTVEIYYQSATPNYFKQYKIPLLYKEKKAILTVNTPIDDLISTEQELQYSRQRYKRIFNHSPVGIFHYDKEFKIKRCNPKFAEMFGSSVERILGFNIVTDLKNIEVEQAVRDSLTTGESVFEGWVYSEFAGINYCVKCHFRSMHDDNHEITGGVAIIEDLTSFMLSQQKQDHSESLLRTVFNSLQDNIVVIDSDYSVVMSNAEKNSEFTDKAPCYSQVFGRKEKCTECKLQQTFETAQAYSWKEHNKETDQYLEVRLAPVKDKDGKVVRVVEHIQDVTQQKRFERKLKKAKLRAEESEKLKTAFLQNISHEIRTPMNSIIGFSELLQDDELPYDQRLEYSQIINNNTSWLLNVMEQIMLLSKIESSQLELSTERLNFNTVLKEIRTKTEGLVRDQKKDLKVITHMPISSRLAFLRTDYVLFSTLLLALVDNAVKFTDSGIIEIGYTTDYETSISFFVKDTGKGIPTDCLESIFMAFKQVDDNDYKSGGNGLGLAIAQGIAESLNAEVQVHSIQKQGSTFSVVFPFTFIHS